MAMADKEYIEREAALESVREKLLITDALPAGIPKDASTFTLASMQHSLESIPAADVRPVVMCCDCKHFQVNVSPSGYLPQGVPEWECRHWLRPTDPTDFCSYGEKREES